MNKILNPAISLMNRMKYMQKFSLIFVLFLLPLSIVMGTLLFQTNNNIEYAVKQKAGLDYNIALRTLVQQIQQHRGLSSGYLGGKLEQKEKMVLKQEEIRKAIEIIDNLDIKYSKTLATSEKWNVVKQEWNTLEKEIFALNLKDGISRHTDLIDEMLDLNSYVADNSKLVLQERLENYYLADIIINKLPLVAEYMGQARATGAGVAAKKTISKDESFKLLFLVQSINKSIYDTNRGMEIVFEKAPQIEEQLKDLYQSAYSSTNNLIATVNKDILESEVITLDSEEYFMFSTQTIDNIYNLINAESDILHNISDDDIDSLILKRTLFLLITIITLSLIVYLFIGFYLSVRRSLAIIEFITSKVAEGDLTQVIALKTKDETSAIENSLNKMIQSFRVTLTASKKVADEVSASSSKLAIITEQTAEATHQITAEIQEVAHGAETQMEATSNTVKAMEEMNSGILHVAESASVVLQSSTITEERALQGNKVIGDLVQQMQFISNSISESYDMIHALGDRSQSIMEIVKVITDIAGQTNLLSLNASIEAARAGEHGKGFSVVADEIRKLADQSSTSAKSISALLNEVLMYTSKSVTNMDKVNQQAKQGLIEASNAGSTFNKIFEATQQVATQIEEVSAASEQMSASSQEITATVYDIKNIAENFTSNAQSVVASSEEQLAAVEEITTSVSMLNDKAQELRKLIGIYTV